MTGYVCLEAVSAEVYALEITPAGASPTPLLSVQQQLAFNELVRVDDPDARQQLIAHNLRLVVNIAKRYSGHGVALLDLIREGNWGLIYALENFKLKGGFRFAAYAAQCVRRHIEQLILNQKNQPPISAFQLTPFNGV